ncbi:hypothetical protein GQR58_024189 [Nymphon striatum]|nr:hypothetical protein GQR58_024189 [Nymphon striatum]
MPYCVAGLCDNTSADLLFSCKKLPESLKDPVHGVKMGVINAQCDDAQDSQHVDWDRSPVNYTCYNPRSPFIVAPDIKEVSSSDVPDKDYSPIHICMNNKIKYNVTIPLYGNHRPNWAKYGEYKFLPPQRWLHNVEHGAVVLLYHPCVMKYVLEKAKNIVRNCLWKHIITPYNQLSTFWPISLVAWGRRLDMNSVNKDIVVDFIKSYAHHGPEGGLFSDGNYKEDLITPAAFPHGNKKYKKDLCPSPGQ